MKLSRVLSLFLFLLSAAYSCLSAASDTTTEAEQRYLIQVVNELEQLSRLVGQAETSSDNTVRKPFYYAGLKKDLAEIRRAVVQHLEAPSRTPRKIEPLRTSAR